MARPSLEELAQVPHFFIASHSIHDDINAAWYETYALNLLDHLFKQYDIVVITGGTGLYIKALIEGLDFIPAIDSRVRENIIKNYELSGIAWLQNQLQQSDPLFFEKGEMQNPQRMMRALEVIQTTGQSILNFRNKDKRPRPFKTYQIGLKQPRDILYQRINVRVDIMMREGLEAEARQLYPYRHLNALQTVGYKELFDYFDKKCTLESALEQIKQNTRRYAKRQMTWFRKQSEMIWIDVSKTKTILPFVMSKL